MKTLFDHNDYKDYLRHILKSGEGARGTQSALAKAIGCQSSYLYQILRGKAELTEDQSFKTTVFLKYSELEREYFLSLVQHSKAASPELRDFLKTRLKKLVENYQELHHRSDASQPARDNEFWEYYFSSILPSTIHILTSSSNYQTINAIGKKLVIDENLVLFHLKKMSAFQLVEFSAGKWIFQSPSIHFSKDSKFNYSLQIARRLEALNLLNRKGIEKDNLHFSTLFTLDAETLSQLRTMITNFVESAQTKIHQGGSDEPFVLNIDLLSL